MGAVPWARSDFWELTADLRTLFINRAKSVLTKIDAVATMTLLQHEELCLRVESLDYVLFC